MTNWIITSSTARNLIRSSTKSASLTGHSPMLPKWAFGYIQSKERYVTQDELISIVREYRRRELPLDCIVLDWKSWTGDLWGQKTLDPERFPNPSQMTADLHALNARLMISIWPIMRPGGANWQEMKDQRSPAGQPGHLQCLQRSSPRLLLGAGQPGPVLPRHRRLVVRLHRTLRSRLERGHQARARRTPADQYRGSQTLPRS